MDPAWRDVDLHLFRALAPRALRDAALRFDRAAARWLERHALAVVRASLGVVFVWFGALKLAGLSPVADLVARMSPGLAPQDFLVLLGAWEVVVGLGLLAGIAVRTVLLLLWLQLAGTFLVLVLRPEVAFQGGNPLLLTVEGEFVVKNLVLIAAGLAVGSAVRRGERRGAGRGEAMQGAGFEPAKA